MKSLLLTFVATCAVVTASATTCIWTNTAGGSWQTAANWSPNMVPGNLDWAYITNAGTYTVTFVTSATVDMPPLLTVGGNDGTQTLVFDGGGQFNLGVWSTIATNGVLVGSNLWMNGTLTVQPGAQFLLPGPNNKTFYSLTVNNQGTMTWGGGNIGAGSLGTVFNNSGLFLITGDNNLSYGGATGPLALNNSGIIRKTGGTGTTGLGLALTNSPGATVQCDSGTLAFPWGGTVCGSFVANAPGKIALSNGTWTDAGGTCSGTGTNLFTGGAFNLRTNVPGALQFTGGDVYITSTNTFQQGGAITNLAINGATLHGTNSVSGTLLFTSGSLNDRLTILPAGQWVIGSGNNKLLYSLTSLDNQGTVICGSSVNVGGNFYYTNSGLWQFTNDASINWGGGGAVTFINNGTVTKTGGTGTSAFSYCSFLNGPAGIVTASSGTLALQNSITNLLGGTFTANTPGQISLSGTCYDAGGICNGTGLSQFINGTFRFRTNIIPGLKLASGTLYIVSTNTFQDGGAITNLTVDGATLAVTNAVSGLLTVNYGAVAGALVVQPGGQLTFATTANKSINGLILYNGGTVTVTNYDLTTGSGTVISNGGLWQLAGNCGIYTYSTTYFTNFGTLEKTTGTGIASCTGISFYNQPGGLVQVDSGNLQLSYLSTNKAGTLRLNGGTLSANGNLAMAGGTLDGAGTVAANAFTGGTISPGLNGTGILAFSSGLNLNSNVTVVINGSGMVPGTQYDQLSVTGAVALANATLQVASLPSVPVGTTFTIITNDGMDAVSGIFNGLPENSLVTVGAQLFRVHYSGGTGNDVTLVSTAMGPLLSLSSFTNGCGYLGGAGAVPSAVLTVRASTNLITWTNIGVATSSVSGAWTFIDTNAWRFARRYYCTTN